MVRGDQRIANDEVIRQIFQQTVQRQQSTHDRILKIIASERSFGEQIDAVAELRYWFRPKEPTRKIVGSYMSGSLSVNEAVAHLAGHVEGTYYKQIKETGRYQEPLHELWDLWNGVIHAGKKIQWEDDNASHDQERLVDLVRALKIRTDLVPTTYKPSPGSRHIPLEDRSILWSRMIGLGLAIAEANNDSPHRNDGYAHTEIEVQAGLNYSAFLARLTTTGLRDCLGKARNSMVCVTDVNYCQSNGGVDEQQTNVLFRIALVWLRLIGHKMWEACCQGSRWRSEEKEVGVSVDSSRNRLPWSRKQAELQAAKEESRADKYLVMESAQWSRAQWCYWKRRLLLVIGSTSEKWSRGSKEAAREMIDLMNGIERSSVQLDQDLELKYSKLGIRRSPSVSKSSIVFDGE
jgi:hypothetical protein